MPELPEVVVDLDNGALGTVDDSVGLLAALVLTGVAATGLPLSTPKVIFSLQDAVDLGITETLNPHAYNQISDFYDGYNYISGKQVATLWIMLVPETLTLTQQADITEAGGAVKVLNAAQGKVRLLGLTRKPGGTYTPVVTDGIDADCLTALPKAHALGETMKTKQSPVRTLIEGRAFLAANQSNLKDLKTFTLPRAGIVLWGKTNTGSSVGFTLGVKAALPRQRKISRVKNGAINLPTVYVGDKELKDFTGIADIHDKGYISMRTFPNKTGFYFTGEPMATAPTDDYHLLSRGCVIDGAHVIAYNTFAEELDDDVEVDSATGQLPVGYIATLESNVNSALKTGMSGEISGNPQFSIVPGQNFLATNKTKVKLKITPKGYQSGIEVGLGFNNPLNGG